MTDMTPRSGKVGLQGGGLSASSRSGRPQVGTAPAEVFGLGLLIRKTEELLLKLFEQGLLSGTTHTCLGQEICQMAVCRLLDPERDVALSNHRNHGHFLTLTGDVLGLVAEIMGRQAGVVGGYGGSQHLIAPGFHSNGIQGGLTAIGVGKALAIKRRGTGGIVAVMIGDGTLGEGLLYESMNLAALWKLPVLFVVENNGIAQTTLLADGIAGTIGGRAHAFGLDVWHADDCEDGFLDAVEAVVATVRERGHPGMLVMTTCRMGPHSKGDDLRPADELAAIRQRDPLERWGRRLAPDERARIEAATAGYIADVAREAEASPKAVFQDGLPATFHAPAPQSAPELTASAGPVTYGESLNQALARMLDEDERVLLVGEDLHDPYGGAFKVTRGLSTRFPGRVISTPISEAGITGAAIGLALSGFRPVVELMFADFLTLCIDQLFNHAVKFPHLAAEAQVPLVLRMPSGGGRGYGPTHSQCLEALAASIPGLTVVYPTHRHDPGLTLQRLVRQWGQPALFVEHKLLYARPLAQGDYRVWPPDPADIGADLFPTLVRGGGTADAAVIVVGGMIDRVEQAVAELEEDEFDILTIVPSLLSPFPVHTILDAIGSAGTVVVVEESPVAYGIGAEIVAALSENGYGGTLARVGAPGIPIPSARSLEAAVLPDPAAIRDAVLSSLWRVTHA